MIENAPATRDYLVATAVPSTPLRIEGSIALYGQLKEIQYKHLGKNMVCVNVQNLPKNALLPLFLSLLMIMVEYDTECQVDEARRPAQLCVTIESQHEANLNLLCNIMAMCTSYKTIGQIVRLFKLYEAQATMGRGGEW